MKLNVWKNVQLAIMEAVLRVVASNAIALVRHALLEMLIAVLHVLLDLFSILINSHVSHIAQLEVI